MPNTNAYVGAEGPLEIPGRERITQAFGHVLSSRLASFYRKAYRMLGNAADAEDAVQDALLAAYAHLDQFKEQAEMSTWVTTIVHNCVLLQLRKDEYQHSELSTRLVHFHTQLSPTLRRTFRLRDIDGLSIRETARILKVPCGTVKAQSARARRKLKDLMQHALRPRSRNLPRNQPESSTPSRVSR